MKTNRVKKKSSTSDKLRAGTLRNGKQRVHTTSNKHEEERQGEGAAEGIYKITGRKYYDISKPRNRIPAIVLEKVVSITHLAIRFYNIKERTNFGQVKVLEVRTVFTGVIEHSITFEALPAGGGGVAASVFIAVTYEQFNNVKIRSVTIKGGGSPHSDHNAKPRFIKTLPAKSLKDMAPYLSHCALALYNIFTLRLLKDPVHDFPSLKVVKAVKIDATNYLVTFQASLRDENKTVETFQTQIVMPTFFPTTTIKFEEIKIIKHD